MASRSRFVQNFPGESLAHRAEHASALKALEGFTIRIHRTPMVRASDGLRMLTVTVRSSKTVWICPTCTPDEAARGLVAAAEMRMKVAAIEAAEGVRHV